MPNVMKRRVLVVATLLSIVTSPVSAGDPQKNQPRPQRSQPRPQRSQQRPRFDSTVVRVRVNAIVTDREGRFVDDLGADDFAVFEDGEPREVLGAQLIDVAAGAVVPLMSGALPATETADLTPTASDYSAMVFLIDFRGLDRTTKLHFTEQWGRFLETRGATTVPQAVYLVDQVGRLREILPLTRDMDRVRAAQQYDLRIMVLDTVSRRVGTTRLAVEIPEVDAVSWGIGDVVLSAMGGDGDPVPIVQGRVEAGSAVAAFIEVRGGERPVVGGRLRLSAQGGPSADGTAAGAELFALPLRRDGPLHRGSLSLPPLAPGDYILELRIEDAAARQTRTVEVPLHVT